MTLASRSRTRVDDRLMINLAQSDAAAMRQRFQQAQPFPHICIDGFLRADVAATVAAAVPDYETARRKGREFRSVNERRKVQICDPWAFPEPIRELAAHLAAPAWLEKLSALTGIDRLIADPEWTGGGIHLMASGGRLDVHVDFNRLHGDLHRRLNLILFLNAEWETEWGGEIEIWDREVGVRHESFAPILNRCIVLETTPTGFHGVAEVQCPERVQRQSFAAYYYTAEPPLAPTESLADTRFRARPNERLKKHVLMPAAQTWRGLRDLRRRLRAAIRGR